MFGLFTPKKQVVTISPSIVIFILALLFCLFFLFKIKDILIIIFMSFLVMVALNPAVNKLQKLIKSRILSIVVVYILLVLVMSSIMALLIPTLASQLTQLMKNVNVPYFQEEISRLKFSTQELSQWANDYKGSINALWSVVSSTFQGLFTTILLLVISIYLIIDEPELHKKIGWFTNKKYHFEIMREFLDDIENNLGGWIRAQTIVMTIVGGLTYLGLTIIGIPYALPLGLLAFMLEILPNLGPTLAAAPAIMIAWVTGGHVMALIVLAFYIVLQQVQSILITPKVMKANADVNALVSIVSIMAGFQIGGIIGSLLAIPVYITARTIYGYYRRYQSKLTPDW